MNLPINNLVFPNMMGYMKQHPSVIQWSGQQHIEMEFLTTHCPR